MIGKDILEGNKNPIKSYPPGRNCRDIRNLESYGGAVGNHVEDNCTNNWDLYQLELNKNKDNKEKMSYEGDQNQFGNIIIGQA